MHNLMRDLTNYKLKIVKIGEGITFVNIWVLCGVCVNICLRMYVRAWKLVVDCNYCAVCG